MNKEFINLKNVDLLDISDVLTKVEKSFNIKLDNEGLEKANTLKSLRDLVISKITLEQEDNCTTQHTFYMLRNAIANVNGINKCDISTHTKLCNLFPKEDRMQTISMVEDELGFKINLLRTKKWIIDIFASILVLSGILCFFNLFAGVAGLLTSAIALKLAGKFGKEMHLKTVGDLACKLSRENYLKVRRNNTINKQEVEQKLRELLVSDLDLEPVMITGSANF